VSGFDYDFFVIGAGSGGVRAARVAASLGARVAVAEEDKVGGTCVIRGCVPKKLLVHGSHFSAAFEDAAGFGWTVGDVSFDWPTLRDNVQADVAWLSDMYIRNLEKSGAELIRSRAELVDRHTIRLLAGERTVTARHILVATGGWPALPEGIPGIEHAVSSNEMFTLARRPDRLLVAGGGYIAVEFAGVFRGLGSEVTVLLRGPEILRGFDGDIRRSVHAGMTRHGIEIACGDSIAEIARHGDGLVAVTKSGRRIEADTILFATGRRPNSRGLGLEAAGVEIRDDGAIAVDGLSRTSVDNIFAVGDVTDRVNLTPVAIREGQAVAENLFAGSAVTVDYDCIPTAVFSQPEAGTVGLTEEAAIVRFPAVDIYRTSFKPLHHRVARRDDRMVVKLVVDAETDRVLGFHAVGDGAGEMAQLVGIAVRMKATKADFDATMAVHPTQSEEIVTMRNPVERHRRATADLGTEPQPAG
jgi:glutathione reductase (NADPH)